VNGEFDVCNTLSGFYQVMILSSAKFSMGISNCSNAYCKKDYSTQSRVQPGSIY